MRKVTIRIDRGLALALHGNFNSVRVVTKDLHFEIDSLDDVPVELRRPEPDVAVAAAADDEDVSMYLRVIRNKDILYTVGICGIVAVGLWGVGLGIHSLGVNIKDAASLVRDSSDNLRKSSDMLRESTINLKESSANLGEHATKAAELIVTASREWRIPSWMSYLTVLL